MKIRTLLLPAMALVMVGVWVQPRTTVVAQSGEIIDNPDLYLPRDRKEDEVLYKVREARHREMEAVRLQHQGKEEAAFDKWRDAFGRYQELRREYLPADLPPNTELMVRAEDFSELEDLDPDDVDIYAETWIPLADYINSRFRIRGWPDALKRRLEMQLTAPGADMLRKAIDDDDAYLLRRCARFYQFSEPGRTALRLLIERSLESADSVSAVRWLEDYQGSWPNRFADDAALQVQYVRACRDASMAYRLARFLRWAERSGYSAKVDVGGKMVDSLAYIREMATATAPAARPELRLPGWRTLHGDANRNRIAPPVVGLGELVHIGADEETHGYEIVGDDLPGMNQDPNQYNGQETPPMPVVFPVIHESGIFTHKVASVTEQNQPDKLLWFRHGREANPVPLEIPKALRYTPQPQNGGRNWWGRSMPVREKFRVLSSSIGRLRWELDNREADVLFTLIGPASPTREKPGRPTGTQIQAFDLSADAALRVTIPNKKVETEDEWGFLQHVAFSGTPLIRDNKLYIAGAFTAKDTFEIWLHCFDVTPKGDPSQGEGKLLWRTQLCAKKLDTQPWGWGGQPVKLPEISSVAEQGGMLYVCTHSGCTAAVDRVTGELAWVSKYSRQRVGPPRGWFNNAPIAAGGFVVTAPYDHKLAIVLDAVTGGHWMEYPVKGKGAPGEYEHVLGIIDNRMIVQGRTRLYSVALTQFRAGGIREADFGDLHFQAEYAFGEEPTGRGIIAGESVLVPFNTHIAIYDVKSGKLKTKHKLEGVKTDDLPTTLSVYCRGEAYKDEDGLTRYKPVTLTDPKTGNVFNVEHLRNGDKFQFPSGGEATVSKETFVILASAKWMYLLNANDGGK